MTVDNSEGSRRPDASMSLIREMLERPLDPGYAAAAERRRARGLPPSTSLRSPLVIIFSVVLGLSLGLASAVLRGAESGAAKGRAALADQIERRRATVDDLSHRAATLQGEVVGLEAAQLGLTPELAERLRLLSLVSGGVAVTGPGVVVTLDDNPTVDAAAGSGRVSGATDTAQRVMARDLQIVTNYLWQSGAEAVGINGHRLTSTTAIRFAGEAILVDYRPLTRPYVVTAIGDPRSFPSRFAGGPGGAYLATLKANYGIVVDTETRESVTLPASSGRLPTQVKSVSPGAASPTGGTP